MRTTLAKITETFLGARVLVIPPTKRKEGMTGVDHILPIELCSKNLFESNLCKGFKIVSEDRNVVVSEVYLISVE